jgi:hypothetical protein
MDNKKTTLSEINSEYNINEIISRDEETAPADMPMAVLAAEDLILQLPAEHEGRRQWLLKYGHSQEAQRLKSKH